VQLTAAGSNVVGPAMVPERVHPGVPSDLPGRRPGRRRHVPRRPVPRGYVPRRPVPGLRRLVGGRRVLLAALPATRRHRLRQGPGRRRPPLSPLGQLVQIEHRGLR